VSVSIGGIPLAEDLTLDPQGSGVAFSQRRCIGGASVVQADGNVGGQTLVLGSEYPYWTLAQVEQIRALQSLGQAVELVHHRGTYQVFIADTSNLTPDDQYADPEEDDWYIGTITLIEVS